jgi:hypothetical protein
MGFYGDFFAGHLVKKVLVVPTLLIVPRAARVKEKPLIPGEKLRSQIGIAHIGCYNLARVYVLRAKIEAVNSRRIYCFLPLFD